MLTARSRIGWRRNQFTELSLKVFLLFLKNDNGDYVECQCDHLSVFAAQGESDDRAGYSLPFFIVFLICLVSSLSHYISFFDGICSRSWAQLFKARLS